MIRYITISFLILMTGLSAIAQDTLTLQEAISIAMQKNHGIIIANNDLAIAENNVTPGNAGMLPRIDLQGGANLSLNNTKTEFSGNIPPIDEKGALTQNYNAQVGLSYTLFDGLGMFRSYQSLKAAGELEQVENRLVIENTLLQVVSAYLEVARSQIAVSIADESLEISGERLSRAENRYQYGNALKLEVLTAEVDYNADSSAYLSALLNLENATRNLYMVLGISDEELRPVNTDFSFANDLQFQELQVMSEQNNASLLIAAQSVLLSELNLKIQQSVRSPRLDLNASYGWTDQINDAGFIASNQNLGFTGGLTLSWNIFNGFRQKISIQNARLTLQSSQTRQQQAELQLKTDFSNAWSTYVNRKALYNLANQSLEAAQLNFERTLESYNLGQVNNTQLREAQLNLMNVRSQIANAQFAAKIAEIDLLRIAGMLTQEFED